jgi:hypothetical protein
MTLVLCNSCVINKNYDDDMTYHIIIKMILIGISMMQSYSCLPPLMVIRSQINRRSIPDRPLVDPRSTAGRYQIDRWAIPSNGAGYQVQPEVPVTRVQELAVSLYVCYKASGWDNSCPKLLSARNQLTASPSGLHRREAP